MFIKITMLSLFVSLSFLFVHQKLEHPVKVYSASELDYPPFSVVKDGKADGFSVELLQSLGFICQK